MNAIYSDDAIHAALVSLVEIAARRNDSLPNMLDTYSYTDDAEIDAILDANNLNRTESTIDMLIDAYDADCADEFDADDDL